MDKNQFPEEASAPPSVPPQVPQPPKLPDPEILGTPIISEVDWAELHRIRANWGIWLGLGVQIGSTILSYVVVFAVMHYLGQSALMNGHFPSALGFLLGTGFQFLKFYGVVLFIWGCQGYAMSKGHHPGLGYLGVLSVFGPLIIYNIKESRPIPTPWNDYFKLPLLPFRVAVNPLEKTRRIVT